MALEFLHKNGVAHMDLKLENLLLDENYTLKIGGFDNAHYKNDAIILSDGTEGYRAPEMKLGRCNQPMVADIYSAGMVLLMLKNRELNAYSKEGSRVDVDMDEFLDNTTSSRSGNFLETSKGSDFSDLLAEITKEDARERAL